MIKRLNYFWRRRPRRTRIAYVILVLAILFLVTDALPYAILNQDVNLNYYLETGTMPNLVHDMHGVHGGFDATLHWSVDDYHSSLVNVDHGLRVTTNQPATYIHTLGMFGNSTMFGYMVADSATLASQLQQLLATTRVINYGMIGGGIVQEEMILESSQLIAGDTALFYDGVVDVGDALRRYSICDVPLGAIALVCNNAESRYPDPVAAASELRTLTIYYDKAKAYCRAHGIHFIHIAQPIIDSMPLRPDENLLVRKFIENGLLIYFQCYSSKVYWMIFAADPTALDFTHILDSARASGAGLYIDPGHLNDAGNEIVARAIYAALDTNQQGVVD